MSEADIAEDDGFGELDAYCAEIDALDGYERHVALTDFARHQECFGAIMLMVDNNGRIAREAYRALRKELDRDSWAKRWHGASYGLGRASIARILGCADHPAAGFATYPFRTVVDDNDKSVIAAAIGHRGPMSQGVYDPGEHLDIDDVLIWDPRANSVTIADDPGAHRLISPADTATVTIFSDPSAFFRAWAARRIAFIDRLRKMPDLVRESVDNELPGALIVGDINRIGWASAGIGKLVVGAGVRKSDLSRAVMRSAHLPTVVEA